MTHSPRNRRMSTSIAAICALALVPLAPLRAAPEEKSDEASKSEKLLTQVTALTAAIEGLRDKSADTVATGGGQLEGALLSSFAIKEAAAKIRRENTEGNFLVASSSDAISTDRWLLFDAQYTGLCNRLTNTLDCDDDDDKEIPLEDKGTAGAAPLAVATALLPFLSSLFRSGTEVSALGGELSDSKLLARAVADSGGEKFRLLAPKRLSKISDYEPYNRLQTLITTRNKVAAANVARKGKKPNEAVAASVTAADEFIAATLTANATGTVPLLDIIRGYEMQRKLGESSLLTVTIEKAGGTMLKRKGIDVALGAPSVRASGGVIISYTVESTAGEIVKTGFLACTTRLTELKRIHQLNAADFKGKCS